MSVSIRISINLSVDSETATVKLSNTRDPIVCSVLGVDRDDTGKPTRIWLNGLIHKNNAELGYKGWELSGAITTIATAIG